jgi:hypothetical protein
MKENFLLTKTLIMKGIQCPKQLFLHINNPELADADKNQKIKQEGNEVGVLAQLLYPTGVLIAAKNPLAALNETKTKIHNPILFEAAFRFENLYCRIDVLEETTDGTNIIEVKSSSEVEDYHLQDLAVQALILKKLNIKLNKFYICHINRQYDLDQPVSQFFIIEDKTAEVVAMLDSTNEKIEEIKLLIESEPLIKIGPHCTKPFECPFSSHCQKKANVDKDSVLKFPNLRHKWKLFESGKTRIQDLTDEDLNTDGQKLALKKFNMGQEYINHEGIRSAISSWIFPLYFLDFETVDSVYPKYAGTKPNTKIPYQFSLFKLDTIDAEALFVKAYLADSLKSDPRYELAKSLVENLGNTGSIVSYNASFEKGVVDTLSKLFPEFKDSLLNIHKRIVDLLPIMRENVYRRDFNWSWSIKSVVPSLFGEAASYKNNAVSNGLEAQALYLKSLAENTLDQSRDFLIEYCNKDVEEMIRIFQFLIEKLHEFDNAVIN